MEKNVNLAIKFLKNLKFFKHSKSIKLLNKTQVFKTNRNKFVEIFSQKVIADLVILADSVMKFNKMPYNKTILIITLNYLKIIKQIIYNKKKVFLKIMNN